MASAGNALTPEQVDAALGPEPSDQGAPEIVESGGNAASEPTAAVETEPAAPPVRREPQSTAEPADTPEPAEGDSVEPSE